MVGWGLFILNQSVISGVAIDYPLFMYNRWNQKLNQHNLGLCHMAKKNVHGIPLRMSRILLFLYGTVSSKITLLESF